MIARVPQAHARRGITLTEILIAIMILGVGLTSLATLFPLGLLRLRDATRYTRTKYLVDSAAADGTSRTLFSANSFALVDSINVQANNNYGLNLPLWYVTLAPNGGQSYALNRTARSPRTHRATARITFKGRPANGDLGANSARAATAWLSRTTPSGATRP